jgi:hypothetical protein
MSFPFDGSFKRFFGGLAGSRAVRRAAKRKQRLLQRRHPGYKFEALEPRILLAADPFNLSLTNQTATVEIEHSSNTETLVHVTLDTGAKTTTTILEGVNDGLLLQGTSGGDDITVIWVETANDGAGSSGAGFSVEIDGGDGHDTVKLMAGSASDLGLGLLGTLLDPVLNLSGDTLADVLSDRGTLSGGTWDLQALTVRAEDMVLKQVEGHQYLA